jgi:large subunit ribosomal protein L29
MKSSEYTKGLLGKSPAQLKAELASLRKEQFNLRIQQAVGQTPKTHLMGEARKNIARVKTLMSKQVKA